MIRRSLPGRFRVKAALEVGVGSVSRRDFCLLAAAAAVLPKAWASPMGMPIGIQLYTVGKPYADDPAGTLKELKEIGYREMETSILPNLGSKKQRELFDAAGLTCPSVHLQLTGSNLDVAFEAAHTLGAHYAVSSVLREFGPEFMKAAKAALSGEKITFPELPPLGLDGFKKTAEKMNDVGRKAKAAGLQYAYHNHNFEFEKLPDGSPGYDLLLKETDPELVKFEVDCGWMEVAGSDPVHYFKAYPGRFRMLHIKDFKPVSKPTVDLTGAGRPQGTDLGTGFVDYKPIFAASKAAGIEHIFVEQETPFVVSQMESARVDFAYLAKFS
jgi:sugar phosphate isomerase/epimerase